MKKVEIRNLPLDKVFSVEDETLLYLDGELKLELHKNDTLGRVMFQGKEMLYADKKLNKGESKYGLKGVIYNCFI